NNSLSEIFSNKDFNSKEWINSLLNQVIDNHIKTGVSATAASNANASSKPSTSVSTPTNNVFEILTDKNNIKIDTDLENFCSNLLSKIQIFQIELNMELDDNIQESLLVVPKAIREIDRIRKEIINIKNKMKLISSKIDELNAQSPQSTQVVSLIQKYDQIKSRMESSMRSLQEAEKLLSFSSQVDQLFSTNDFLVISNKLEEAKQSLSVLSDVPEFREQSKKFNEYQDRLESQLRPLLQSSLISRDLEACKKYLTVFTKIQRQDKFLNCYFLVKNDPLKILWNSYSNVSTNNSSLHAWLSKFYDEVLLMVNNEFKWLPQLFPTNYIEILESLVVNLFTIINPTIQSRVDSAITIQAGLPVKVEDLLSIYKTTLSFIKSISSIFPNLKNNNNNNIITNKLLSIIIEPYKYFQNKFSEYEIKSLKYNLSNLSIIKKGDFQATVKNIEAQLIPKFFQMATQSIERFLEFTHTTDIDSYVNLVQNQFFTELTGILRDSINELKHSSSISSFYVQGSNGSIPNYQIATPTLDDKKLTPTHSRTHSRSSSGGGSGAHGVGSLTGNQNWEYFQGSMNLLQSIHKLLIKFSQFDNTLILNIIHYLGNDSDVIVSNIRKLLLQDLGKLHKLQQSIAHLEQLQTINQTSNKINSNHSSTEKKLLLQESLNQINKVLSISQHFVYETMIYFIKNKLKELPKIVSTEWNQQMNSQQLANSNLTYITQITDHLLTIPQQLDPYSEEELTRFSLSVALQFPIKTSSVKEDDFYQNLLQQYQKEKQEETESFLNEKLKESGFNSDTDEEEQDIKQQQQQQQLLDEELEDGIAHQWITIVAKATEKLYLQTIVEIITLSESSCQQLSNDIGYLFNVLSALGVSPESLLLKTKSLLEMDREQFIKFYHSSQQQSSSQLSNAEKNICNLIAKMRNIK
ncbi:hypothetical protein DICPUDRAFT_15317, partial [Dictyostelium purpureum]